MPNWGVPRGATYLITMEGIELRGAPGLSESPTSIAVHSSGQIAASLEIRTIVGEGTREKTVLVRDHILLLRFYCKLCDGVLDSMETDVPYLLRCSILDPRGLYLERENGLPSHPCRRSNFRIQLVRSAGQSFVDLHEEMRDRLYWGFGEPPPS